MSANNHIKQKGTIKPDGTQEVSMVESFMPDPETLRDLEQVCPGASRELMNLVKDGITGRQRNERALVRSHNFNTIASPICGFLASLAILVTGIVFLKEGYPTAGSVIITGSIASTVAQFYTYRRSSENNKR